LQQTVCGPAMQLMAEQQPQQVRALMERAGVDGVNCWIEAGQWAGATLLWVACRLGCLAMARLLVESGADVNHRCHSQYAAWRREAPLHTAARYGHHEVLEFLVQVPGVQLHRFKDDGASPIFLSVQEGHVEATRVLVAARCDVNFPRFDGNRPLILGALVGMLVPMFLSSH
jgi:ankyrin repeat protein